jgi:hypothetical protein
MRGMDLAYKLNTIWALDLRVLKVGYHVPISAILHNHDRLQPVTHLELDY